MDKKQHINIPEMLVKLNEIYDKEELLKIQIEKLTKIYYQLQEDKKLLQTMIMYQSNTLQRFKK